MNIRQDEGKQKRKSLVKLYIFVVHLPLAIFKQLFPRFWHLGQWPTFSVWGKECSFGPKNDSKTALRVTLSNFEKEGHGDLLFFRSISPQACFLWERIRKIRSFKNMAEKQLVISWLTLFHQCEILCIQLQIVCFGVCKTKCCKCCQNQQNKMFHSFLGKGNTIQY